jgi:cell wall-associated NlpC family hydrolase
MTPDAFAAAAEALLGAPFRLGGRDPATGVDCVGLVACALGGEVEAPEGYALRNSCIGRHLAFAVRAGFVAAEGPTARGDLVLAVPGPAQHHLLVVLGRNRFVHAHAGLRRVTLHLGPLPWPVLSHWRLASEKD